MSADNWRFLFALLAVLFFCFAALSVTLGAAARVIRWEYFAAAALVVALVVIR
jgi:hypothetical protein